MFRTLRTTFAIAAFTALSVTVLTSLAEEAASERAVPSRGMTAQPPVGSGAVRIIDMRRQTRPPEAVIAPVPARTRSRTA